MNFGYAEQHYKKIDEIDCVGMITFDNTGGYSWLCIKHAVLLIFRFFSVATRNCHVHGVMSNRKPSGVN